MYISIKNRLIFLLIAFTLLPFILLRIIAYPRVQADLQDVLIRNLDGIGHKQAELVTNWMRERTKDVRVLACNPLVVRCAKITKDDADYVDILQYLEVAKFEYGYRGILVGNEKGQVTIATIEEGGIQDISGMDYFQQAMEGNTFVSGIVPSKTPLLNEAGEMELDMPTMFVSAPLKDRDGAVIGVISLRIDVDTLNDLMLSLRLGKTGETYLVNRDGYMITESRLSAHLKDTGRVKKRSSLELKLINQETGELTDGVRQCVAGNNGFDARGYKDYRGHTVLGVWRWLKEFNWGIIAEIDRDEGYGAAYNLNRIVSSVLLALALPIVLIAYLIGRKTSSPILQLTEVTKKMALGDLTQRVDIQRKDEIGVLANSFNAMAKSLDAKAKEIAASEKRYRELVNSIREGVYQSEPEVDGVFTWVNQAGAEILGYKSPAEVIGTRVKDIYVNPDERRKVVDNLNRDGVLKNFTSFCKRKNGEQFYMERTSNLVSDEKGCPVRIDGIFRDITERKRSEEKIQESEWHHRQLLNSLKEGIYQCEPTEDGVFTWINQAGAEILGYKSPAEVVGARVRDIYVNPDERKRIIDKLQKEGALKNFASLCRRKNGEQFYMERTSCLVTDEKNKTLRIEGIFRDITERKILEEELQETEGRHQQMLNLLEEGVFQSEPGEDGVFTWINQAGAEMLGYGSIEDVIGTPARDVYVNPGDRKELMKNLEKEGMRRNLISYCKKKDGERFISKMTCTLLRDINGKAVRVEGIFRTRTEK